MLWTAYSFLDPKEQGSLLAAYIAGIGLAEVVLFGVAWLVMWLRQRLFFKKPEAGDEEVEAVRLGLAAVGPGPPSLANRFKRIYIVLVGRVDH